MRIGVNTRFLLPHKMEGFGWYTYEIVKRIVENHPEHEFIFFFDRAYDSKFIFGKNVTPVVLFPQARHPFLFYWWFEYSIPKALKKYNCDLFFSPDGYLSLSTSVKQIGVIHDLNFEHNPKDLKWIMRNYYLKYFPRFAKKADKILTVSEYSKSDILTTYNIPEKKVVAIWNGASEMYRPLMEQEKDSIRMKYSQGKPYLLFVGALHPRKNVGRLIKAFDKVKTLHPEIDHQLIIVGTELWNNAQAKVEISQEIKAQIHFTGHLKIEELALIMGAADVFTYIPYFEGFGIPLVEAMKCGTPILSGNLTSLPEVAGEAAIYCNPMNDEEIATQLHSIIVDKELKVELSKRGMERSKLFSWDNSSAKVWDEIASVLNL